ncbi:arylsulfatase B-like [Tubulanus polymorphus]|uniref:arylsulfatase B-like n=1 Tax=Tubulanus polymorphus TaxID=672921 RepID=UPI003DA58702
MSRAVLLLAFGVIANSALGYAAERKPHVVFIVADDLGWNDVSWHNPDMITPNLEKLARSGVILNHTYVQHWCSPSRSAFMSGYFPYHTGMQHNVIPNAGPYGLPLNLTILPQYMKKAGYATHMVGKWHQGFCKWEYTPTERGFDSFYGYYVAREDHYTHSDRDPHGFEGFDFRDGKKPVTDLGGKYGTDVFAERAVDIVRSHDRSKPLFLYLPFQNVHGPVQVPEAYEKKYEHVHNRMRRKYSGMVTILDEAIGNVTRALEDAGMFDDTVIIFTTDNGGQPLAGGNNWPLRGAKTTLWEGGTRGVAFVRSRMLKKSGYVYNGITHASDWFPTILSIAGMTPPANIDGRNIWKYLSDDTASPRDEFVYNIDELLKNGAIRKDRYKLIVGNPGHLNSWYPVPRFDDRSEALANERCMHLHYECADTTKALRWNFDRVKLFDIDADPTEHFDVSKTYPEVTAALVERFKKYLETLIPGHPHAEAERANPKYYGGFWSPGWC